MLKSEMKVLNLGEVWGKTIAYIRGSYMLERWASHKESQNKLRMNSKIKRYESGR